MALKVSGNKIQTVSMDHHWLVAAACKDLGIAEKIDARRGTQNRRRIVSTGKSVVAMILNGLGLTNHRLYLSSQFFETKPVEHSLDEGEHYTTPQEIVLGLNKEYKTLLKELKK